MFVAKVFRVINLNLTTARVFDCFDHLAFSVIDNSKFSVNDVQKLGSHADRIFLPPPFLFRFSYL